MPANARTRKLSTGRASIRIVSESRADDDTVHVFQVLFYDVVGQVLAIGKVNVGLAVIIRCIL